MKSRWVVSVGLGAALFAVADRVEAQGAPVTGVADGNYRCHKMSPSGGMQDIGPMQVRGGRATVPGFPDSWVINKVYVRSTNDRGEPVIAVDYRSSAGFNDSLDCLRR